MVGIGSMMVLNVVMQLVNGLATRRSTEKNQKAQFEFQKEIQAEQWEKSQALQKEIRELNAKDTQENQRRAAENQRDLVEMQYELNHWPLSVSPAVLRKQTETYLNEGKEVPLHVIVSSSGALKGSVMNLSGVIKDGMREAFSFISMHYSRNSEAPVIMYTNADSQKELGPEQVDTIYAVLPGAPVIVLMPQCQDTCFVLKCSYWGVGDVQRPEHLELFRCDLKAMQNEQLRQFGASWPEDQNRLSLPEDANKDSLHKLVVDERFAIESALQRGATDDEIRIHISPRFEKEYAKKEIVGTFQHAITQNTGYLLNSACKTIVTLLADTHYLLTKNQQPKLPFICQKVLEDEPELLGVVHNVFSRMIEQSDDLLSKPLMRARLSSSYKAGGFLSYAEKEQSAFVGDLKAIIVHPEDGKWLTVDDLRCGVQEMSIASGGRVEDPFFAQCSEALSLDDLNKRAIELYKRGKEEEAIQQLRTAVEKGSAKAGINLAIIYHLPRKEWESVARCFHYAQEKGINVAPQTQAVVRLCRAGYWKESFPLLLPALSGENMKNRQRAIAYTCLLMLTNLRMELASNVKDAWCAEACKSLKRSSAPRDDKYPQLALIWLQTEAKEGSREARDALISIACRLWREPSRPLLGVGTQDAPYRLESAEKLWPDEEHRKAVQQYLSGLRSS